MARYDSRTVQDILKHFASLSSDLTGDLDTGTDPPQLLASLIASGRLTSEDIQLYLSRRWSLRRLVLQAGQIEMRALEKLPPSLIRARQMIPFQQAGQFLKIAIIDPAVLEQSALIKSISGAVPEFHLISPANFDQLAAGVAVLDALAVCTRLNSNLVIREAMARISQEAVSGVPLSSLFAREKTFPEALSQLMAVGEKTGNMDEMLEAIARYYEEEFEALVSGLATIIEPLMIVIVGALIGALVVALYLPIFSAGDAFSGAS